MVRKRALANFIRNALHGDPTVELGDAFIPVPIGIDPHKSIHTAVAVDRTHTKSPAHVDRRRHQTDAVVGALTEPCSGQHQCAEYSSRRVQNVRRQSRTALRTGDLRPPGVPERSARNATTHRRPLVPFVQHDRRSSYRRPIGILHRSRTGLVGSWRNGPDQTDWANGLPGQEPW